MSDNNRYNGSDSRENEEYRAIFERIEKSGKRFAEEESSSDTEDDLLSYFNGEDDKKSRKTPAAKKTAKAPAKSAKSVKSGFSDTAASLWQKLQTAWKNYRSRPKRKLKPITKLYKASVVMFAAFLVLFGFISAVDKNKTVSKEENRALAQKPKFTFSSLFSGKYTVDFENFYSDAFPARSFFIKCNTKINDVFTRFSGGKDGEVVISTQKNDDDFVGEGVDLLGDEKKQKKEGMKENTAEVTPDDQASIQGSVLVTGTRALEIYYHSDDNAKYYTDIINKTAKSLPEGVKFYSMLCPTAMEFYGTAQYREGVHSQRDSIQKTYSMLDPSIIKVDAYSNLVDNVKDYIYFRTDHHWTARGAYCGYQAFCEASGNTAPALSSFATHRLDGFLGSLFKTTQSSVLSNNPDYVECFDLTVDAQNTVYASPEMTPGSGVSTYIVAQTVNDSNKYLAFIAGDQPLEKITTSVKNGKKILVIKESYGNAFVPFLCNNYEEIYVIDPRWIDMNIADFVATNGIGEVIAINYMFAIGNKTYCNALGAMSN